MRVFLAALSALMLVGGAAFGQTGGGGQVLVPPSGISPTTPIAATNGTSTISLADRFGKWTINVRDKGATATGLGGTDDTLAFSAAVTTACTNYAAGFPSIVYIPAGAYYLNSATPIVTPSHCPVRFQGDGSHQTFIYVGPNYSGDIFSWSEAWSAAAFNGTASPSQPNSWLGASVVGLSIMGSQAFTNVVNGIHFYDRDDFTRVDDVVVHFLHGQCVAMGDTLNISQAYVRESSWGKIQCFSSGTATLPSFKISSTASSGSDSTNELYIDSLNIFGSYSSGLQIRSPGQYASTRLIHIMQLRVEYSQAGDDLDIGLAADAGIMNSISIGNFQGLSPQTGYYAVSIAGATNYNNIYGISINSGNLGPGSGGGVYIGSGHGIRLSFDENSLSPAVTLGSGITCSGNQIELKGPTYFTNNCMYGGAFNTSISAPSMADTGLLSALLATDGSGNFTAASQANIPSTRVCTLYTTPGTTNYTIPSWANSIDVYVIGGGSSGANGTTAASGTATSGGAGGSGGAFKSAIGIPASSLTSPISVLVGVGGAQPSGSGASGNAGTYSIIQDASLKLYILGSYGGAPSGGSTGSTASGGAGGIFSGGGNASGATAGTTPYGYAGVSGNTGGSVIAATGNGSPGASSAAGLSGNTGYAPFDSGGGAGSGGGVSAAGVGQNGGGTSNIQGFGNFYFGAAPGGNAGTLPTTAWPGTASRGGGGGAGGDASHAGGNGAVGSGPGAAGGGGGSTIAGMAFGLGAAGQSGAGEICANR